MGNEFIFRNIKKPPCGKNCPDREVGCHSTCEPYIKWEQEHHQKKEAIDKIYKANQEFGLFKSQVRLDVKQRRREWKHIHGNFK